MRFCRLATRSSKFHSCVDVFLASCGCVFGAFCVFCKVTTRRDVCPSRFLMCGLLVFVGC